MHKFVLRNEQGNSTSLRLSKLSQEWGVLGWGGGGGGGGRSFRQLMEMMQAAGWSLKLCEEMWGQKGGSQLNGVLSSRWRGWKAYRGYFEWGSKMDELESGWAFRPGSEHWE